VPKMSPPERHSEPTAEPTSPNATAWEDDKIDVMESWADDRPVNWNEKIVFSDEENEKRDWATESPEPKEKPTVPQNEQNEKYERSYDRRNQFLLIANYEFFSTN